MLCEGAQTWMRMGEEWNMWVNNGLGRHFQAFTCAISQKHFFSKMGGLPNSKLTSIPFPSKRNNFLNQLLDDWAQKTKRVVDNLMGFSLWHWIYPIGSRVWLFPPPYSLLNHAPISLTLQHIASCGIFINMHFYMMSPNIYCAWLAHKPSTSILIPDT